MYRSRRELSNAYLLAKFRFDTAENEPSKVCPIEPSRMRAGDGGARDPAGGRVRPGLLPGRAAEGRRHLRARGLAVGNDNVYASRAGKLDRARSRLYRSQILQENMRLKALAEIYTMHSFAHI